MIHFGFQIDMSCVARSDENCTLPQPLQRRQAQSILMASQVVLDLGCGRRKHAGAIGVDNVALEGVDVLHNLLSTPYPFASGCAGEIILSHVLEHFSLDEINAVLSETYRLLAADGVVTISVPHALSVAFNTDPTHKTRFTFETFYYFTPEHVLSYYSQLKPMWKIERLWASVNLFNNLHVVPSPQKQRLEHAASRVMSYLVRRSRSLTLPDLIVKQLPFWLVSIHVRLGKSMPAH
jgi:SAM-dependent methyltransferase